MKAMVLGNKRHGKDTLCEILEAAYGVSFASSSWVACKKFLFNSLKDVMGYKTPEECFEDRDGWRELWYQMICAFNSKDRTRLGKLIFSENTIYCGCRDREEFEAMKAAGMFDLVIWVDASERLEQEDESSLKLTKEDADIVITNNTTLEEFTAAVHALYAEHLQAALAA
jgi:hypothetical protein